MLFGNVSLTKLAAFCLKHIYCAHFICTSVAALSALCFAAVQPRL